MPKKNAPTLTRQSFCHVIEFRKKMERSMIESVRFGVCDPSWMSLYCDKGYDVNVQDTLGNGFLHYATQPQLVNVLLDRGALVDLPNAAGQTPLMMQLDQGASEICHLLIARRANLAARDGQGRTPFFYAKSSSLLDLLGSASHLVDVDDGTMTLFAFMAHHRRFSCCGWLANHVSPSFENLCAAIKTGQQYVADLFIQRGAPLEGRDAEGRSLMHLACQQEFDGLVNFLLFKKISIDAQDVSGETPLFACARNGREDVAQLLLERGADPSRLSRGESPLSLAVRCGHVDVVDVLLFSGAPTDWRSERGETLLHLAVQAKSIDLVSALVKRIDVNATTRSAQTALHMAAFFGLGEICKMLIKNGAKCSARNKSRMTAFDVALQRGYEYQALSIRNYVFERGLYT